MKTIIEKLGIKSVILTNIGSYPNDIGMCYKSKVRKLEQQKNEMLERNIKFLNNIIGHGIDADSEFVEIMEKEIEEFKIITEKISGKSWKEIKALSK